MKSWRLNDKLLHISFIQILWKCMCLIIETGIITYFCCTGKPMRYFLGDNMSLRRASLIVQLVKKICLQSERPWFESRVRNICWRRDRLQYSWVSTVAQLLKNLPAVRETWVQSLGWEDPLEKGKATHSSILAWRIPNMDSQRVGHDWVTFTFTFHES